VRSPDRRKLLLVLTLPVFLVLTGCGDRRSTSSAEAPAAGSTDAASTAWPMTRGGPDLGGNVAAAVPNDPAIAWTFTGAGPITAEAAIFGGRVFIGTETGVLHGLDARTGRELWKFTSSDAITAAPAVDEARVYVASNDGRLYALDAGTGAPAWQFAIDDKISAGAVLARNPANGAPWVLVNGYDGTTRALDAADGSVVWTYTTEDFINGAPAVVDGRLVVFGGCDARLHVVNLADGSLVHSIETDAQIPSSIGTFGTMAFCGNYANQAVAFDVLGGSVAWTYADRALPFFSSPAVNERLVVIGSRDKHLHAIHRESGEVAWKFRTGGRVEGSPILFRDGVVFGSSDGRLYAAALDSGQEEWRLELGEALVASPAFGHGMIVIGGEKGTVFAIRAGNAPEG
jgi:outer membrane protein assembly factor BamB